MGCVLLWDRLHSSHALRATLCSAEQELNEREWQEMALLDSC